MCFCVILLVAVRVSFVFWKKTKNKKPQLSQHFMKSHSGRLQPKVSRKRGTACLPLIELVPALHVPVMISEKPRRQQVPTSCLWMCCSYSFRTRTIQTRMLSLQTLNRTDVCDMLWAWLLHVTAQVISLQHNHTAQLTLLIGRPPLLDYQQNFTHNAKQKHLYCTTQAILH